MKEFQETNAFRRLINWGRRAYDISICYAGLPPENDRCTLTILHCPYLRFISTDFFRVPVNCELLKLRVASCKLLVVSHKGLRPEVSDEKVEGT